MRQNLDEKSTSEELRVLNEFRDEVVNLSSSNPMMRTQCEDTMKVIDCLRFIKVNEDFIRYAFDHPEDLQVYTYHEDKEKEVLRDDNGTAFHINREQGLSTNDYIRSFNHLIEQVEGAFELVREHRQIRTFVQSFLYDGDIGCLEARTSSALLFAGRLSGAPEFIDFDDLMSQVAQNFQNDEEEEEDARMIYKAFEHYENETFRHGDHIVDVTWEYIQNYMRDVLGFSERSPYEVRNLLNYKRSYEDVITQMREKRSGIKLVSCPMGENRDIDFLLEQLADSAHVRPVLPLSNHNPSNVNRSRVRDTKNKDNWSDREVTLPRGRDQPGRQYIKKTSLTYQDEKALNKVYEKNIVPVGIHFNLEKCDFKNDKYCWTENGFSVHRWWIQGHKQADHYFAQSVTFEGLKNSVMVHGSDGFLLPHNEILVCPSRESVSGVFATENTLLGRLNAFRVMLMIRKKINVQVPMYVHVHPSNQLSFTREERTFSGMLGKLFDEFSLISVTEKKGEDTIEMKGCRGEAASENKETKEVICKKYRLAYLAFLPYFGRKVRIIPSREGNVLITWEKIKDRIDEYFCHPEFNGNEMAYIECRPREYTSDEMQSDIAEAETALQFNPMMNEIIKLRFEVSILDRMPEELLAHVQHYPSYINENNILDIIDIFYKNNLHQEVVNFFRLDIMRLMSALVNTDEQRRSSTLMNLILMLDEGDEQVEALSWLGQLESKILFTDEFIEFLVDMGLKYYILLPTEYLYLVSSYICRTENRDRIRIYYDTLSKEDQTRFLSNLEFQMISPGVLVGLWREGIEKQAELSSDIYVAMANYSQENNDVELINEVFVSMLSRESVFIDLSDKMDKENLLNFLSHIYLHLDMEYSDIVLRFLINNTFDLKEDDLSIGYYERLACYLINKQKTCLIDVFSSEENDCLRRTALIQIMRDTTCDISHFLYLLAMGDPDAGDIERKEGAIEYQNWIPEQTVSFLLYAIQRREYTLFDKLLKKPWISIFHIQESMPTLLRELSDNGASECFFTLLHFSSKSHLPYLLDNLEGVSEAGCIEIFKKAIEFEIDLSEVYDSILQSGNTEAISGIASQAGCLSSDQVSTLVDRKDSLSQNAINSLAMRNGLTKGYLIQLLENSTYLSEDAFRSLWLSGLELHLVGEQESNDLLLSLHEAFKSVPTERTTSLILHVVKRSSKNNVMNSVYRARIVNFLLDINIWALSGCEDSEVLTSETKVSAEEYSLSKHSPCEDSRHPFSLSSGLKRKKNMATSLLRQWVPLIESLPLLEGLKSLLLSRSHWVKIMNGRSLKSYSRIEYGNNHTTRSIQDIFSNRIQSIQPIENKYRDLILSCSEFIQRRRQTSATDRPTIFLARDSLFEQSKGFSEKEWSIRFIKILVLHAFPEAAYHSLFGDWMDHNYPVQDGQPCEPAAIHNKMLLDEIARYAAGTIPKTVLNTIVGWFDRIDDLVIRPVIEAQRHMGVR